MFGNDLSARIAMINKRQKQTPKHDDNNDVGLIDAANELAQDAIIIGDQDVIAESNDAVQGHSEPAKAVQEPKPQDVSYHSGEAIVGAVKALRESVMALGASIDEIKAGLEALGVLSSKKTKKKGKK